MKKKSMLRLILVCAAIILVAVIAIAAVLVYESKHELGEPHIPAFTPDKVKLIERTATRGRTSYLPANSIDGNLPVIVLYPPSFDNLEDKDKEIMNLEYWDNWNDIEVKFHTRPKKATYVLYDESLNEIYSAKTFTVPTELGEYILQINAKWDKAYEFFAKIIIGEPRYVRCGNLTWQPSGSLGLVLREGFHELLELESELPFACTTDTNKTCPCFLQTSADVQNLYSWLRLDEFRFPFSDKAELQDIQIHQKVGSVFASYKIGKMVYDFKLEPDYFNDSLTAEDSFGNWKASTIIERVATIGDVNIYAIDEGFNSPSHSFIISVNGTFVTADVSIPCKKPNSCGWFPTNSGQIDMHGCGGEKVNRRAAIRGMRSFEFRSIF